MSTTQQHRTPDVEAAAAAGVGARITLAVMSDRYVEVLTEALAATDATGLEIDTDQVSTFVRGTEQRIASYLSELIAAAARSGEHVVATVMLSRGCPGEVCGPVPERAAVVPSLPATGVHAQAQWALYPLLDGGTGPVTDHLAPVWAAIERARERGSFLRSEHFVTTLAGDLAEVLTTVVECWSAVGQAVPHVATHVTIGANSPSADLR